MWSVLAGGLYMHTQTLPLLTTGGTYMSESCQGPSGQEDSSLPIRGNATALARISTNHSRYV